jgi:hypothetical protein
VHQTAVGVDDDVRLHGEMPFVAFLGLVHLRVALALGVLGSEQVAKVQIVVSSGIGSPRLRRAKPRSEVIS